MICYKYCLNVLIGLLLYTRRIYGQVTINVPAVGNYGEETHMNCQEANFNIVNGYIWYKDNVKIYDNINGEASTTGKYTSTYGIGIFTLNITNTEVDDAGVYACDYNFDAKSSRLDIEAKGNVTAELSSSSSGKLKLTFQKIYPSEISVVITCDSIQVTGAFVTNETDGTLFTRKWESSTVFSSKPSACSVAVTLRTRFSIDVDVISVIVVAVIVGLLWWQIILIVIGSYLPGSFGIGVVVGLIVRKNTKTTIIVVEGDIVTLSCPLTERFTFPEWRGPPSLTTYTNLHDPSGAINPAAPAFERLQYASNKRDLILSDAVVSDSGDYKCSYPEQGDHTITLIVNRGERCKDHVSNNCECKCCACFNIKGLPSWYKILWLSIIGSPVAFGMWVVMKCCGQGKGDKACNDVNTGSHPNEKKKQGRPQPPPPGANHREGSGSVVSGRDVEMQETDTSLNRRQLPDIHDRKGRGLSANYTDDDHPLVSINIPTKKPGALESIPDSAREEVTKKKKKKKKKRVETEDDQSD